MKQIIQLKDEREIVFERNEFNKTQLLRVIPTSNTSMHPQINTFYERVREMLPMCSSISSCLHATKTFKSEQGGVFRPAIVSAGVPTDYEERAFKTRFLLACATYNMIDEDDVKTMQDNNFIEPMDYKIIVSLSRLHQNKDISSDILSAVQNAIIQAHALSLSLDSPERLTEIIDKCITIAQEAKSIDSRLLQAANNVIKKAFELSLQSDDPELLINVIDRTLDMTLNPNDHIEDYQRLIKQLPKDDRNGVQMIVGLMLVLVGVASCVLSLGIASPMSTVAIGAGVCAITGGVGIGLFSRGKGIKHSSEKFMDLAKSIDGESQQVNIYQTF